MYHARLLPHLHLVSGLKRFSASLQLGAVPRSPYHRLLNLDEGPNQFIVDLAQLRRNFIQAQRLAHPDKVATQGADAVITAGANSAELNRAYQTLFSPLKRAEYLLSLRGINIEETDKLDSQTDDQAEFIMEVMETRSALEEADSEEELTRIRQGNKLRIQEEVRALEEAFSTNNTEGARKASIRLRYWEGIEAAAKDLPNH